MESYKIAEKILNTTKSLFTTKDIGILLEINNKRTLEQNIKKLIESEILTPLERGKYFLTKSNISDFSISQFIYSPSYISLETALNIYGILSQFPFEITSITLKKSVTKTIQSKTFKYSHIQKSLFTGYIKKEDYLIATPEKALFDYLYLCSKSIKTESYLNEMDFEIIKKKDLFTFINLMSKSKRFAITQLIERFL